MNHLARAIALSVFTLAAAAAHADRYPDSHRPVADHRVYQVTPAQAQAEMQIWRESGLAFYERLGHADASALPGLAQARARFQFLMASERHEQLVRHYSLSGDAPPALTLDLREVGLQPSGLTRAEVLADLRDWRESGMAEFDNTESASQVASGRYEAARARYALLRELRVLAESLERGQQG